MSAGDLNLSRRPFVNGRPVVRVALLLWLLGGLLLLGNVFVSLSYVQGTGDNRKKLAEVERMKAEEQRKSRQLEDQFARLNLAGQNEQVDFLNEKIAERTFSWSQLFDRMSRLLPSDVRLTRLSPRGVVDTQLDRRRRGAPPPRKKAQDGRVTLVINGESKNDQELLKFVDNLFADPAFIDPNLLQQTRDEGKGVIRFDLRVEYLPRTAAGASRATVEPAPRSPKSPRSKRQRETPEIAPIQAPLASRRAPLHPGVGVPGVGVGVPPRLSSPGSDGGPGR